MVSNFLKKLFKSNGRNARKQVFICQKCISLIWFRPVFDLVLVPLETVYGDDLVLDLVRQPVLSWRPLVHHEEAAVGQEVHDLK
jgi:hypothetical protein